MCSWVSVLLTDFKKGGCYFSIKATKDLLRKSVKPCIDVREAPGFQEIGPALAMCLSSLESSPVHQEVTGSIPSQGKYLGYSFDPWLGHMGDREPINISISLSLSLPSSLSKNQQTYLQVRIYKKRLLSFKEMYKVPIVSFSPKYMSFLSFASRIL